MHAQKLRILLYFSGFFSFLCVAVPDDISYYQKWVEVADSPLTLRDLAGSLPTEIDEIVKYLTNPHDNPGKRGYIFYGPPGTGKSTFAQAIAGHVGGTCLSISGSDFEGPYIGTGPERIDQLFKRAYELVVYGPVIIFIDEIEAVGTRSSNEAQNSQYEVRTLDKLITQISSLPKEIPIVVIGATNHPKKLDSALIRPGRCKLVEVQLPDLSSRLAIIDFYCEKCALDLPRNQRITLAKKTNGFNHAGLEDLLQTASKLPLFEQKHFNAVVQDSIKAYKQTQKISNEKEEREKRRDELEKLSLANARIGWWATVVGLTVTLGTGAYQLYYHLPEPTKNRLRSYVFAPKL